MNEKIEDKSVQESFELMDMINQQLSFLNDKFKVIETLTLKEENTK
jgi:hypothetical protein